MEDYLPILNALRDAAVQYVAIGTWALKIYFPAQMADYVLHDCDIVLAPNLENVQLAIHILRHQDWEPTIWGESVDAHISADALAGKYYVRATQEDWVLDLTYGCVIPWGKMQPGITSPEGIPLASVDHIMALKRYKAIDLGTEAALDQWLQNRGLEGKFSKGGHP